MDTVNNKSSSLVEDMKELRERLVSDLRVSTAARNNPQDWLTCKTERAALTAQGIEITASDSAKKGKGEKVKIMIPFTSLSTMVSLLALYQQHTGENKRER
jgi:hypothetical protein